jgi:hypothetical protein
MLNTLLIQGGLLEVEIGDKFVSIGIPGGYIFVGCKIGVFVQIKDKLAHFFATIHCYAPCTNLVFQSFLTLSIV